MSTRSKNDAGGAARATVTAGAGAWGALIATALWKGGSALFSLYVSSFGSFNKTYGSVAAIVVLTLWFLVSAYALLIGAELNAELARRSAKSTAERASASA